MRLDLRRKLHPYKSLRELADAYEVTLPHLKKCLRDLETAGEISLSALARGLGRSQQQDAEDDLFAEFHRRDLCLVCGSELQKVENRQAGWGEFSQCGFCGYSAHENADFTRLREVAEVRIAEMRQAVAEARRILDQREKKGRELQA